VVSLKLLMDECRQNVVLFYVLQQRNIKTKLQFNHNYFVITVRGLYIHVVEASTGGDLGVGILLSSRLWDLGERHKLRQRYPLSAF